MSFRIFVASPADIRCVEAAPGIEDAYDLMIADNVPAQEAADMAVAAAADGRDPVAWAQHFVKLRQAMRKGFA